MLLHLDLGQQLIKEELQRVCVACLSGGLCLAWSGGLFHLGWLGFCAEGWEVAGTRWIHGHTASGRQWQQAVVGTFKLPAIQNSIQIQRGWHKLLRLGLV